MSAGKSVWDELGLPNDTQLMPLKAISRAKGRPNKKDANRVSAYNPRAAQPTRPTVNAVGELLYVQKNKCRNRSVGSMGIPKAFVKAEVTLAASLIQCKRNCTSNGCRKLVQRGSARGLMSLRRVTELIYSVF